MRALSISPALARPFAAGCAALALAACTERGQPLAPRQPATDALVAIRCTAMIAPRTIRCTSPERGGSRAASHDVLYGGQHLYVDVISGPPSVVADTYAFTITLRNLIPQPVGTTDGTTPDPGGVKVFFGSGPVATEGSGMVTVANPDGVGVFTEAGQPFFRYVGVVPTGSLSSTRTWKIRFEPGVVSIGFLLYISSPVPHPDGWVDITPASDTFMAGYDDTLHAVVRTALGTPVPGASITWSGSAPDSAPVTPLPGDSLAVVHGAGSAAATITAGSGTRSGSAAATVLPRQPSEVSVTGRQLIVRRRNRDGTLGPAAPYAIRGVTWSPAGTGTNTSKGAASNAADRRPEFAIWAPTDVPLIAAMNANTVRLPIDPGVGPTQGRTGLGVLDQLHRRGIMAIVTVDDAVNDTARVRVAVTQYRDHPAVLMWMLGNEWNINRYYGTAASVPDAAQRTQAAALLAKSLDAGHPVAGGYGDIDIDSATVRLADTQGYVNTVCPAVDVWGLNIYRGRTFEALFQQWASISGKPMFMAEFGTDAFRTTATQPVAGSVDQAMQVDWDLNLWSDLYRNLSALDGGDVALGGTVFEWNDEWWKVGAYNAQENGGYGGGHPDGFANEEWFGIVDIARAPRQLYGALQTAFAPGYVPPAPTVSLQAISQGSQSVQPFGSFAEVRKDGLRVFWKRGDLGGRGFNVVTVDPATGAVSGSATFDTFYDRDNGNAHRALVSYLQALPDGTLLLIGVADEAGLNQFDSCAFWPANTHPWVEELLTQLESLGATHIRGYCYRDSWAMAVVKGNPASASDQRATGTPASATLSATLH